MMKACLYPHFYFLVGLCTTTALLAQTSVVTYHNDPQRTGWNQTETSLTPASVAAAFRHIATVSFRGSDGTSERIDAQPLVVANQQFNGALHTVVYVATENNNVYAVDGANGAVLTHRTLGTPRPGSVFCKDNGANVGVNSTGTIDLASGTFYVMAYVMNGSVPSYQLHALDLATLNDRPGSPVTVKASQTLQDGSTFSFDASVQRQRPALLDANGRIYAAFGSFCDSASRGWVLSWSKKTLAPQAADELTNRLKQNPNQTFLSSIWMSGYGLATDSAGSVYFTTGNSNGNYNSTFNLSNSALKINGNLSSVESFFTPSNTDQLDKSVFCGDENGDCDYGSGGLLVVPDQPNSAVRHLAVAAGKDGRMFILNRDAMGGFHSPDLANNVPIGQCFCGPSYFQSPAGPRLISSGGTSMTMWSITSAGGLAQVASATVPSPQPTGFFTSISSNGFSSAIIWAVGRPDKNDNVTLYAFDAAPSTGSLRLIWSSVAGTWPSNGKSQGKGGNGNIVPTVANGRVYVASYGELQIFSGDTDTSFSVSVKPTSGSVNAGAIAATEVTVTSLNGIQLGPIAMRLDGLTDGSIHLGSDNITGRTCTFAAPVHVGSTCSFPLQINTASTDPPGTYTLTVWGQAANSAGAQYAMTIGSSIAPSPVIVSPTNGANLTQGATSTLTGWARETDRPQLIGFEPCSQMTFLVTDSAGHTQHFPPSADASYPQTGFCDAKAQFNVIGQATIALQARNNAGVTGQAHVAVNVVNQPQGQFVFQISAAQPGTRMFPGGNGSVPLVLSAASGSPQAVQLSASGLPAGATAQFSPNPVTPTSTSTVTIATTSATPPGTYSLTITGVDRAGAAASTNITLFVDFPAQ